MQVEYLNEKEFNVYFVKRNRSQNLQFRPLNIQTHEVNSNQEVYPADLHKLVSLIFPTLGFPGKEGGCTGGSTGQ